MNEPSTFRRKCIFENLKAKCKIVNDIFSLKGKNLIARKSSISPKSDKPHFPDLPFDIRRSRSFSGRGIDETAQESPEIDPKDLKSNSQVKLVHKITQEEEGKISPIF